MKSRSYCIRPNPDDPEVQKAFAEKRIPFFTRYTSITNPNLKTGDEVIEEIERRKKQLCDLGAKSFSLKTGGFGAPDLALGICAASDLGFELFTIDDSGGGTGMSPVDVMDNWGIPSILLHSMAWKLASRRKAKGMKVVDLAFGGGIAKPGQIFKDLCLVTGWRFERQTNMNQGNNAS